MAYGQIDPARLDGDALARWYLRSPADIEDQRKATAARRYADFFGDPGLSPDDSYSTIADQSWPDPEGGQFGQNGFGAPGQGGGLDDGVFHAGQDDAQITPTAATAWNCPTCHTALPLPPQLQPLAPLLRNFPRSSSSGGAPDDRKQCEIQDRNDRRICGRQPYPEDKAICHASASVRWKNCLRTGHVGDPPLDTAKRMRGSFD